MSRAERAVFAKVERTRLKHRGENPPPVTRPRVEPVLAPVVPIHATPLDPHRKPHRAIRALVDLEGQEAPRELYAWFDMWNERHFGGQLGSPLLFISHTSSPRALGDYIEKDEHGLVSRIRVAPRILRCGWFPAALAVLLHEMIHAWQHEIARDLEPGYKAHGPKFAAKANEIGADYGFEPCAPKGRGGLARAESWPFPLVGMPAKPPKPRKPEPEAPEAPEAPEGQDERAAGRAEGIALERGRILALLAERAAQLTGKGRERSARLVQQIAVRVVSTAPDSADAPAEE